MENIVWAALPLIGLVGGFCSGLLGLGGGVIMLPLLTMGGGVPLKLATGTDLVHVLIAAATSTLFHYRAGRVDVKAGLILGLAGVTGGLSGSFLSVALSPHALRSVYLFVVATAILLLFVPAPADVEKYQKGGFRKDLGIVIGLGAGLLTGLLGVGGGFLMIPLMTYCLRIPLRVAIGTSLLTILITSLGTLWAKFGVGHIDLAITPLVLSGSVAGALTGSLVSRKASVPYLRAALLALLISIFLVVGYRTLFL